jgi:hypothetical protein
MIIPTTDIIALMARFEYEPIKNDTDELVFSKNTITIQFFVLDRNMILQYSGGPAYIIPISKLKSNSVDEHSMPESMFALWISSIETIHKTINPIAIVTGFRINTNGIEAIYNLGASFTQTTSLNISNQTLIQMLHSLVTNNAVTESQSEETYFFPEHITFFKDPTKHDKLFQDWLLSNCKELLRTKLGI